ncbi:MAG: iron-containing alcohol dehydrogenase [Paenibacillaceae bacterium]
MSYILEVPPRIVSGWGSVSTIGTEVAALGRHAMLVYSERLEHSELLRQMIGYMENQGVRVFRSEVPTGEPTIDRVETILRAMEINKVEVVVGIGGGSILDTAKAAAGLCFSGRKEVKEYFYGLKPDNVGIPWVAVPTTSGTGAEATPNSVLSDEKKLKQSIRGDASWLPHAILLDPMLTVSCTPKVTAWSGMDALTQAIEAHTSKGANVLTEPYSLKASQLIVCSLKQAYENPKNQKARTDMAYGSLLAGIALANARLGIVHGIAHSIGLHYNVPHGLVCGTLLPWAIKYNNSVSAHKYGELAKSTGIGSKAEDLIEWVVHLNKILRIPPSLKEFGLDKKDFPRIVEESMPSGSLKANPRHTTEIDLIDFLQEQLI